MSNWWEEQWLSRHDKWGQWQTTLAWEERACGRSGWLCGKKSYRWGSSLVLPYYLGEQKTVLRLGTGRLDYVLLPVVGSSSLPQLLLHQEKREESFKLFLLLFEKRAAGNYLNSYFNFFLCSHHWRRTDWLGHWSHHLWGSIAHWVPK